MSDKNFNFKHFWANDGIRTRDLVLTKDALYQLSYGGFELRLLCPPFDRAEDRARTGHPQLGRLMLYQMSYFRLYSILILHVFRELWYATCKLYFKLLFQINMKNAIFCIWSGERRIRTFEVIRQQIYSLSHLATLVSPLLILPFHVKNEPMEGFEPPTHWLQISSSGQLSYIGSNPPKRNANVGIF